ncbi:SRR1-like protein [Saccoglossus kowalevskii]|uniref:SRR1-like protein-like n=1 Tax=Saccoglossus kowalevskii TaxID=10224 RepID=A0ABM0M182_SACKO|nr:PREDICTED: SRR1-like protein-like [Saccoglossus kowalevskii]
MEDTSDGFQVVRHKRRKKKAPATDFVKSKPSLNNVSDTYDTVVSIEIFKRRIRDYELEIENSEFFEHFKTCWYSVIQHLAVIKDVISDRSNLLSSSSIEISTPTNMNSNDNCQHDVYDIVCYGLGNFTLCPIARYQFAFLHLMTKFLQIPGQCFVYDPKFTEEEKIILKDLDFHVIDKNEECKRPINRSTVFHMPHCGKPMYNNLLWSNWSYNALQYLILIGNSFNSLKLRFPSRILQNEVPYIHRILPYTQEIEIDNNFQHSDIFNDTSLHYFPADKISKIVATEFWQECNEPLYKSCDSLEITQAKFNV